MPRVIGVGGRQIVDLPVPNTGRMTANDVRREAGINNTYTLVRQDEQGCPEELNGNDYVQPDDSIQLIPRHIVG